MKLDRIRLNQNLSTKEEALSFISSQMKELGIVGQASDFLEALHEREAQGTTGLTDGFAIPHGKSGSIRDAAVIYIRNDRGIDWETLDGSPVTDLFALAIPENGADSHLDNLIAISTSLMDEELCERLRAARDEKTIEELFA